MSAAQTPVLVTGASRGIGAAVADAFAAAGHPVAGTATTEDGARALGERLTGRGAAASLGIVMDVTDPASVEAGLERIRDTVGAPLVLVNNAGITRDDLALRMKAEAWDAVIAANLSGPFRVIQGCLRTMTRARRGRIINIGSVVARMGNPGQGNYVAAKAGLEGLTRSLALELARRSITVNTVAPGFIESDMTATLDEGQREAIAARIPQGRMGTPADVAALCLFLAGDGAGYVTGQTIAVNGGLHLI